MKLDIVRLTVPLMKYSHHALVVIAGTRMLKHFILPAIAYGSSVQPGIPSLSEAQWLRAAVLRVLTKAFETLALFPR